ncbi:MAG TPA: hypothetical protein EYN89_04815 [Flavobacteriales bacterium]|nr:hypothetical protein [Flavobacteriales bacterium]
MMKRTLISVLTLILSVGYVHAAGTIILEGNYQGKNLFVQNPFTGSGVGFCTFEVTINDQVTTDEINSSAFEIDFTAMQLEIGTKVVVKIKHGDDCKPKVLNPEVLKPKSTFDIVDMKIDDEGMLEWITNNETGKLPYVIEQFRWNKWVKVGEEEGKGQTANNSYTFKVTSHSGENKFRVKQVDYSRRPRYSSAIKHRSKKPPVTFAPQKVKDNILFSDKTMYEIYDAYGNIVKKGFGDNVDVSNLKRGTYYINYDKDMGKFLKK